MPTSLDQRAEGGYQERWGAWQMLAEGLQLHRTYSLGLMHRMMTVSRALLNPGKLLRG